MSDSEETGVSLGRIVGLFGVRGWVKIFSYTDPREAILEYKSWQLRQGSKTTPVQLSEGKRHGKSVIARFEGVEDRDAAAGYLEAEISVPRSELPETDDGSFYWTDLEGLSVVRQDGESIGQVERILETGANDVLVVKGDIERLIPFVMNEFIVDVDLDNGVITVDWEWD
ncbi:MAG: ribosome maturation factor RimM [Woeseiaceae bacterium]|nr:ribosome maturation factor RimM [Woeseiaceae bacterium]